jgi:hypothetical protein
MELTAVGQAAGQKAQQPGRRTELMRVARLVQLRNMTPLRTARERSALLLALLW